MVIGQSCSGRCNGDIISTSPAIQSSHSWTCSESQQCRCSCGGRRRTRREGKEKIEESIVYNTNDDYDDDDGEVVLLPVKTFPTAIDSSRLRNRCNNSRLLLFLAFIVLLATTASVPKTHCSIIDEQPFLKDAVVEMFDHAFNSYMNHAYPADELMPISCTGRIRGVTKSRGDVDDALGNFSLALVDSLDTLFILGKMDAFERAVRLVISDVQFDTDVVVSVFETNIRMLGGLLSGHVLAQEAQQKGLGLTWYSDELLKKAEDLGQRLLVAYSSTTGLPHPRINLRRGLRGVPNERTTCTACAGSVLLEMAALSRLTGNPVYEEKARRATVALWDRRNRYTNLVGSIMNVDTGEWVRSESGVGAGSDSYYEYLLKAYILLGDIESYHRFAQHYESIMRYQLREGFLVDVPMNSPHSSSRNVIDALSAFWPGLQTLIGDLGPAVRAHENLYALVRKYRFLPEAVTLSDYRTHWAHHPLRPEFVESTYFLYKATKDPHYLEVGRDLISVLNATCRVDCGFAAIDDVNKMTLSDQMDSYLLAETFKYLYLLFSDPADLPLELDEFVFTTEGHVLPISLSTAPATRQHRQQQQQQQQQPPHVLYARVNSTTCPNHVVLHNEDLAHWASRVRAEMRLSHPTLSSFVATSGLSPAFSRHSTSALFPQQQQKSFGGTFVGGAASKPLIAAIDFNPDNAQHLATVRRMGLVLIVNADGRAQLWHRPETAESAELSQAGLVFMRDMVLLQAQNERQGAGSQCPAGGHAAAPQYRPVQIWLLNEPHCGKTSFQAGPSQFGANLEDSDEVVGQLARTHVDDGCVAQVEADMPSLDGAVAVARRGGCTFAEKARAAQTLGAQALVVVDSEVGTSQESTPFFALSADVADDITIPVAFLFHKEGEQLLRLLDEVDGEAAQVRAMLWRQPKDKLEEDRRLHEHWSAGCDDSLAAVVGQQQEEREENSEQPLEHSDSVNNNNDDGDDDDDDGYYNGADYDSGVGDDAV